MNQPQSAGDPAVPDAPAPELPAPEPPVMDPAVVEPGAPDPATAEEADPVGSDPVGSDVVESDVVESDVVESDVVGSDVVGSDEVESTAPVLPAVSARSADVLESDRPVPSWVEDPPAFDRAPDDSPAAEVTLDDGAPAGTPDRPAGDGGPHAGAAGDLASDLAAVGEDGESGDPAGDRPAGDRPADVGSEPGRRASALVAAVAVVALVAGIIGGFAGGWAFQRARQNALRNASLTLPTPARTSSARAADSVAGIARTVLPSVVAIKVTGESEEGTGSGFVIDPAGYILTNNHVVEAAATGGTITVVYSDGTQNTAKIVGRDASYDLAVVKADTGERPSLRLGDSDAVLVGDPVIAVGAPLGLQGTVTTGIVSALNRPVAAGGGQTQAFINAIQTDAAINPGNSGGPLVNAVGQVIGINSAIARAPGSLGTTSGNIGLGFAIPSNQARRTAQELIRTGHAQHPVIGVLLDRSYDGPGVKVSTAPVDGQAPITPGGPADKAGIRAGDVIVAFNGRPVTDPDELVVAIRAQTPGQVIRLTVRRAGADQEVRVTLQASSK